MTALPVRLFNTLFSPSTVMEELRDEPKWFGALALGAVVVALSAALIPAELSLELMRAQMAESGRPVPDSLDAVAGMTRILGVIGAVVFWFVFSLFLAGISSVIFAFVLGDDGRFKQYLAVVSHALIILALGGLVTTPLRIVTKDIQLTLGLGTFAQAFLSEGYLLNVLHGLDFFSLWTYAVIAVGISRIDARRSWTSAFIALMFVAVALAMLLALAR